MVQLLKSIVSRMRFWKESSRHSEQTNNQGKMLYLESVRGLAALAVVFSHTLMAFYPYPISGPGAISGGSHMMNSLFYGFPLGFTNAGIFAVVLFFVLSGYVLTYRYFQTHNINELKKQAAKRYPRLAIPVFFNVMLVFFMLSFGAFRYHDQLAYITGSGAAGSAFSIQFDFFSAIYNATIGVFANGYAGYNVVLWTMSIELFGSFIVFGLASLLGQSKWRWMLYVGALIFMSQSYFVCFILGMLLSDLVHNTNLVAWTKKHISNTYAAGILLLVLIIASTPLPGDYAHDHLTRMFDLGVVDTMSSIRFMYYLGAFLLIWIVVSIGWVQKILSIRPLVYLGSLSFSIYLLHFIVIYSVGSWAFVNLWGMGGGLHYSALGAAFLILLTTVIVSMFWKKYIDDMSVRVSRRFAYILLTNNKKKVEDAETEIIRAQGEAVRSASIAG